MSDFFGNESVFKKPAIPSRYQRTNLNNHSAYNQGGVTSGYTANKLKEKIEILEKVFPQNDNIWESLIKNVDHLCFIKISEQVFQCNSQQSILNGVGSCPSLLAQNIRLNERGENNYTQSTNNIRDYLQSQNYQRFNSQDVFTTRLLQDSKQQERYSARSQTVFPTPMFSEPEQSACPRDNRLFNVEQTSRPAEYNRSNSRNALLGSQDTSQLSTESNGIQSESQIIQSVNVRKNLSRQHKEATKENDFAHISKQYAPNSLNSRVKVSIVPEKFANNELGELNVEFGSEKHRDTTSIILEVPVKHNREKSGPKSNHNSVASVISKIPSSRRRDRSVLKNIRDVTGESATSTRPSKQQEDDLRKKSYRDLSVLNSEDENDSLATFFQRKKKVTGKKVAAVNNAAVPSVILSRSKEHCVRKTQKRQFSELPEDDSISNKRTLQSEEDVVVEIHNRNKPVAKPVTNKLRKIRQKTVVSPTYEEESMSNKNSSQSEENTVNVTENSNEPITKQATRKLRNIRKKKTVSPSRGEESKLGTHSFHSEETIGETAKNGNKRIAKETASKTRKKNEIEVNHIKKNNATQSKHDKALSKNLCSVSRRIPTDGNSPEPDNFEQAVHGSFFGEVSSILENGEVSLLQVDRRRRRGKQTLDNDASMPFFSPFAPGNSRSTSGFSAISTPLSKSASKNVLGKRIKKPSVVAELKNELKGTRKNQNNKMKPKATEPVLETTATTESECEVSDFSDVD